MNFGDLVRVGLAGLRARPGRVVLSALGIAIGIATMVAVIGISASSKEQLLRRLDRLGSSDSGLVPSSARSFSWHDLAGEGSGRGLALVWSDFRLNEAPGLRVTAMVRLLDDSALSEWRIAVDSPGAIAIEQVRFPRIAGIPRLGGGEEHVGVRGLDVERL